MALMLAGYQCDKKASMEIHDTIQHLSTTRDVSEIISLQARMVFHADYGNIDDGVAAARHLISELARSGDVSELFRARCNAATVCRIAGLFDESQRLFEQALELATSHGLAFAEQRAIPPFAHLALETANLQQARRLYERLMRIPINAGDHFTFVQQQALAVRLALCDGDPTEARRLLPFSLAEVKDEPVYNKRTYNLALLVAVELRTPSESLLEAVRRLEDSFARSKTSPHQAFSAFVLYSALKRNGHTRKAAKILNDYETKYRREPWPAPRHLLQSLERSTTLS